MGQERVLLRLVEAVDLVDEQQRAPVLLAQEQLGPLHRLANVLDAALHRADRDQVRLRDRRDDAGERRLPRPWRSPEDERRNLVSLDRLPQERVRPQDVPLTDDLVERAWPHPFREGNDARIARSRRPEQVARLPAT